MEILDTTFLGNSIRQWAIGVGAMIAAVAGLYVLRAVVVSRLTALSKRTSTDWDDILAAAVAKTRLAFVLIVGVVAGMQLLALPERVLEAAGRVLVIAGLVQAGIWAGTLLAKWLESYRKRTMKEDPATTTTVSALGFVGNLVLWAGVLLLALDNLGVDITALVAGLGIGGVAVALALQNVLGDLFASLSIVLDKPFVLGDFLIIDDHLGSVEHIGLKTTRLRSLSGEQLVFSNSDLLGSRVRNFGRMYERRVVFPLGVTYQTPREKLEAIPGMLKDAVEAQEQTRFDRAHLKAFGDFSINFETVYYVKVPDYTAYMDVQQAINLRLHEQFENEAIEFAYPTQTLFLARQEA